MRHYIICIFLLTAIGSQAQQINPVPDYVFRNQMSVGRNAVTDTAAYISIGPRYGANKGLMPPIVSDTAAITGVKRNGLLIFSVQRNNFQYWDSINSRWTSVTATVDTTVISTRAWRKKGDDSLGAVIATRTDTTLLSTRAWRQKGLDSLAAIEIDGSGTVNYVPKFTATRTLGNSQIFDNGTNVGIGTTTTTGRLTIATADATSTTRNAIQITDETQASAVFSLGNNLVNINTGGSDALALLTSNAERLRIFANGRVGVNTTTDAGYQFDVAGSIRNTTGAAFATTSGNVLIGTATASSISTVRLSILGSGIQDSYLQVMNGAGGGFLMGSLNGTGMQFYTLTGTQGSETVTKRMEINSNGEVLINPGSDAGDYKLQVSGNIYNTGSAVLAATSGNVGIGTTSPSEPLDVNGRIRARTIDSTSSPINVLTSDVNGVIRKTAPGVLGSGTTNYIPKFTASGTVGNSQIQDDATSVAIGSIFTTDKFQVTGNTIVTSGMYVGDATARSGGFYNESNASRSVVFTADPGNAAAGTFMGFNVDGATEAMRINSGRELLINTTTDAGDFRLQVNGNANFRDDVLIDTNLRVNRHISLDQTPKAWALGNAIEGPQGSTLFVAGGGVQTLANVYYDGSYKYSTSNPGAAMFLLQSGITFATYGSGTANGALTGANEMVYAGGELRVGIADQGTFKLQVADKSYLADEVQIASTTDLGNYKLQVTGEAIITAGIRTDAPSGGTAATWKLGTVATVSPTSPNRTIEVEIGGTTYYIHAKTTNN